MQPQTGVVAAEISLDGASYYYTLAQIEDAIRFIKTARFINSDAIMAAGKALANNELSPLNLAAAPVLCAAMGIQDPDARLTLAQLIAFTPAASPAASNPQNIP